MSFKYIVLVIRKKKGEDDNKFLELSKKAIDEIRKKNLDEEKYKVIEETEEKETKKLEKLHRILEYKIKAQVKKARERVFNELTNIFFSAGLYENDEEYLLIVNPIIATSEARLNVQAISYWNLVNSKNAKKGFKKDFKGVKDVKVERVNSNDLDLTKYTKIY